MIETMTINAMNMEQLASARHVIIGAGGFLGTNLVNKIISFGFESISIDILSRPRFPNAFLGTKWLTMPLSDVSAIYDALQPGDIVYHLAGSTNPSNSDLAPDKDIEDNLIGSIKLFQVCIEKKISKLVFVSSGGTVYGPDAPIPTSETAPKNPICSYGITKLAVEKYLELFRRHYGLEYTVFRVSNAYGPFQIAKGQGIVATALQKFFNNQPVEIWGDGRAVRDYLYAEDISEGLLCGVNLPENSPRVFNLGSGIGYSVNEILSIINSQLGGRLKTVRRDCRIVDVPSNILNIDAITKYLRWRPLVSIQQGIAQTIEWYKDYIEGGSATAGVSHLQAPSCDI